MNQGEIATTIIGTLTLFASIIAAIKGAVWLMNYHRERLSSATDEEHATATEGVELPVVSHDTANVTIPPQSLNVVEPAVASDRTANFNVPAPQSTAETIAVSGDQRH
ncbi:hypothetical protein EDC01DRAFT_680829, partial [Geopyxis carbonaria]